MPSREEVNYFGAGPAPLPTPVLEEASRLLLSYNDSGVGLCEISHRSGDATKIIENTKSCLAKLLDIPTDDYEIMFLHGGGSGEFSAVVYHMVSLWVARCQKMLEQMWKGTEMENASEEQKLRELRKAVDEGLKLDYFVTGGWSQKAHQEAIKLVGKDHVQLIVDSREHNNGKFGVIPTSNHWNLRRPYIESVGRVSVRPALTYYCDNETVDGVEFPTFPKELESSSPEEERFIVADMSSNFLSRKVDVKKYSVIFGGAQKNIGSTGITIVIIRKSLLPPQAEMASPTLLRQLGLPVGPVVFDFPTIAKNNSLYNTLPIFDVWIAGKVMERSVKQYGDVSGLEKLANEKGNMIYGALEQYPDVYNIVPAKNVRSRMNICVRVQGGDDAAEKEFLAQAEKRLLLGLKGHRSVGGIRISNYNAVSMDGAKKLVQFLEDFGKERENKVNGS